MKEPIHIKLLQELNKKGIGVLTNISPILMQLFTQPVKSPNTYDKEIQPIKLFISDLTQRGFISFLSDSDYNLSELNYKVNEDDIKWLDLLHINVYLTSMGIDYLEKYEQSQINKRLTNSYIDTNKASKTNYKNQTALGVVTLGLALTTAIISALTYVKTDTTAASVDSLRLEIRRWRIQKTTTIVPSPLPQSDPHKP